jgi:hypothetical protein
MATMTKANSRRNPERLRLLRDIMITFYEGGGTYWAQARKVERERDALPGRGEPGHDGRERGDYISMDIRSMDEHAEGDGFDTRKWARLDVDVVARGLRLIVASRDKGAPCNAYGSPEWRQRAACGVRDDIWTACCVADRNPEESDIDADVADCIVQAGLYGHIIFG